MYPLKPALVLLAALSPSVFTETALSDDYAQCMERAAGVTMQMVACIGEQTQMQDQRLNRNYQHAMTVLAAEQQEQLRQAQRQWINFRDAECMLYVSLTGGSLDRTTGALCYLELTQRRADSLATLAKRITGEP